MGKAKKSSRNRRKQNLKKKMKKVGKIVVRIYGFVKGVAEAYGHWELLSQLFGF